MSALTLLNTDCQGIGVPCVHGAGYRGDLIRLGEAVCSGCVLGYWRRLTGKTTPVAADAELIAAIVRGER